jgi:hypothetical protein
MGFVIDLSRTRRGAGVLNCGTGTTVAATAALSLSAAAASTLGPVSATDATLTLSGGVTFSTGAFAAGTLSLTGSINAGANTVSVANACTTAGTSAITSTATYVLLIVAPPQPRPLPLLLVPLLVLLRVHRSDFLVRVCADRVRWRLCGGCALVCADRRRPFRVVR